MWYWKMRAQRITFSVFYKRNSKPYKLKKIHKKATS